MTFTIKNLHNRKIQKRPLMVLMDTGSEKSVIKATHSPHGIVKEGHTMKFHTPSGTFSSKKVTDTESFLNEFSELRHIRWKFHVLPEDCKLPYDMIIGRDLMRKLKIDILYSNNVVTWDKLTLPMHEVEANGKWHGFNALVEDQAESESVKDSMSRLTRILGANYDTPVLEDEVAKMTHLNPIQRNLLLALLKRMKIFLMAN